MIEDALKSAALILGLGISVNTIYLIVRGHIARGRQRRALVAELKLAFEIHLRLIRILAGRASGFVTDNATRKENAYDELGKKAREELKTINVRADQVLAAKPGWDLAEVAGLLDKKQFDFFVRFLDSYVLYRERLDLRLEEFRDHPNKPGVMGRFLASAGLSKEDKLDENYAQFTKSVGEV